MAVSPYENAYIVEYPNGEQTLERFAYEHNKSSSDVIHTVLDSETIQSIAFQYYGDSGYWYKIADINGILNPMEELVPGAQIVIPLGGN